MAKHEFGIMQIPPTETERFDTYEPEKYNCISIDDCYIETILAELDSVDCYWHTLATPGKGLAYCGVTILPPKSLDLLISILLRQNERNFAALVELATWAKESGKFIIHYGL